MSKQNSDISHILKALGGLKSGISKVPSKDYGKVLPTGSFGDTYNQLLEEAKKLRPSVPQACWPPIVEVATMAMTTTRLCKVRYPELISYVEMIINHLEDDGPLPVMRQ